MSAFTPQSDRVLRCRETTRCAISDIVQLRPRPLSQGEERDTGQQLLQRRRSGETRTSTADDAVADVGKNMAA
jgi:hypothetical protein